MNDSLIHVTRADQAETMRQIRNTCLPFMTGDQRHITAAEQLAWFESIKDSEDVLPFLYEANPRGPIAGFGLVRIDKPRGYWVVSGGLLPEFRGRGLGHDLFWELTDYIHRATRQTAWLDVFEDNISAVIVYRKIGYRDVAVMVDGAQGARPVLTMRKDPP